MNTDAPFQIAWETITPQLAAKYLQANWKNRKLRKALVESFARDMKTGRWLPNHQGIAFDKSGNLLDGQHRLNAIIRAAIPVPMLVFRDVPTDQDGTKTMHTIDRGASRSIADLLNLEENIFNANLVAAICAALAAAMVQNPKRTARLTMPQTMAVLEMFRPHIKWIVENHTTKMHLRTALVSAAVVIARAVNQAAAEEFYQKFTSGAGLTGDSPALALREYIMAGHDKNTRHREARLATINKALTALHAQIERRPVQRLGGSDSGAMFFLSKLQSEASMLGEVFPIVDSRKIDIVALGKPPKNHTRINMLKEIAARHG